MSTKPLDNGYLYRCYLAIDRISKRLASCGVGIERVSIQGGNSRLGEAFWRAREEDHLREGEVPPLYKFADVQVYIDLPVDYSLPAEEREREAQSRREQLIRDFTAKYPDAIVARYDDGESYIYTANQFEEFGVTVNVGRALCERVLVGEDVTEIPDPELAEKALEQVPKVKKVTPRYEWRCNDAELMGARDE